jgi:DNA polymerase III delta prime subunit
MPLRPLYGHEAVRRRLLGAVRSGRLPQAILFEGPQGVGKQRLALWLAQAILCEQGGPEGGCGSCQACRMAANLTHPDLHWLVPLESPKRPVDADKQVEQVETALAEEMAERRERPLYAPPSGMALHSLAAVRLLLRRAALTPAMSRHKVFIVGDAERLLPQRATTQAANALLKILEEPPADTFLFLTAERPDALLPTILSRVVRVRVGRLPDSVVTAFTQNEIGEARSAIGEAEGSIGRLLALSGAAKSGGGAAQAAEGFLATLGEAPDRYRAALGQMPFQARGRFADLLDGLLERLREEARRGGDTRRVVEAMAQVLDAREATNSNVNPQLLMAVLADDLAARPWH